MPLNVEMPQFVNCKCVCVLSVLAAGHIRLLSPAATDYARLRHFTVCLAEAQLEPRQSVSSQYQLFFAHHREW